MKPVQAIDIGICNIFWKSFGWFRRLGRNLRPFLLYQPTLIIQKPSMMWF